MRSKPLALTNVDSSVVLSSEAAPVRENAPRADAWSLQPEADAMSLNPTLRRAAAGLVRDPGLAVSFVQRFDAQEGLPPERLAGKEALLRQDARSFFSANPALFYADLNGAFADKKALLGRPAPRLVIDGDAHLGNFGTFRGADGHTVWGLNDFDQAGTGSPEWDLERLATSAVLAARQAGLDKDAQKALVQDIGRHYFGAVQALAKAKKPGSAPLGAREASGPVRDLIDASEAVKRGDFLAKWVEGSDAQGWRFLQTKELRPVTPERAAQLETALRGYERGVAGGAKAAVPLRILATAEKLGSGGSSFGLNRYYVLVANADPSKKPVVLEVKQLLPSPLPKQDADLHRADADQVVGDQQTLGSAPNPLTGAATLDGYSYLVRELEPEKARVAVDKLGSGDLTKLCEQAAEVLARSHAQVPGQAAAIQAWVKDDATKAAGSLWDFARSYADQAEADFAAFKDATSGKKKKGA